MVPAIVGRGRCCGENWTIFEVDGMGLGVLREIGTSSGFLRRSWVAIESPQTWLASQIGLISILLWIYLWVVRRLLGPTIKLVRHCRLDMFLISSDWLDLFPEVCQIALPKPTSDHCPILLETKCERWGPTPFRFELMWLEEKQFVEHIKVW